jgi:hypothetical protein
MNNTAESLRAVFPLVSEIAATETRGMRILPISSDLLACLDHPDLIAALRSVLPADASIFSPDGQVWRMRPPCQMGRYVFDLLLLSATWPMLEEGALIPELQTRFYRDERGREGEGLPFVQCHSFYPSRHDIHELVINKRTHELEIPSQRETEEQLVAVVKPKKSNA